MITLALETATDRCSVAIARDGNVIGRAEAAGIHQHASHLTLLIDRAREAAGIRFDDLDRLLLSDGPGSYTSLRVGAATAKGLLFALPGVTFTVVPTLAGLAVGCDPAGADRILATLNSRRGEVYGQVFRAIDFHPESEVMNVRLTDPKWRGSLLNGSSLGRIAVCGPGQERVRESLDTADNAFRFTGPLVTSAVDLLQPSLERFYRTPDVAAYEPFYLNAPHVTQPKKRGL